MYAEVASVLVSLRTQVQQQIILDPDYLPDYPFLMTMLTRRIKIFWPETIYTKVSWYSRYRCCLPEESTHFRLRILEHFGLEVSGQLLPKNSYEKKSEIFTEILTIKSLYQNVPYKGNKQILIWGYLHQNVVIFPLYILLVERIYKFQSNDINTVWSWSTGAFWYREAQVKNHQYPQNVLNFTDFLWIIFYTKLLTT